MWLDRLSNQPTPSGSPPLGQNRSFSPAPRRPNHLTPGSSVRPGYSPRSSSLSVVSRGNASTGSLPAAGRIPNGSTLKQEITPPINFNDPLEVLEGIIGSPVHREAADPAEYREGDAVETPQHLAEDIAFAGKSLQDFANASLDSGSDQYAFDHGLSVEEYEQEKHKFQDLHHSILACDNVLKSVESSLTSFQKDLGLVSAEIETLQSRSTALNTRLENRKVVEKLLGPAVEDVSISPAIVRVISEGPIDENWLKALAELEKRSKVIDNKLKASDTIKSVTDIKPLLDNLNSKAVERIRDYLVAQIKAFRSPNINAQIIQQQTLLRYKDLYGFLSRTHPQLAEEILQAYINTIRWYYLHHFTRYRQALSSLSLYQIDKNDALGSDPSTHRPSKPSTSTRPSQTVHDATSLSRRADILKIPSTAALPAQLAEDSKMPTHIETPFRNFNLALIDNATAEYSFLTEFFALPFSTLSRRFAEIFEPTFAVGRSLVKDLVEISYDCLGILLCVRLNQHFAFELQRRKVPALDGYINALAMLLWPRFQVAMDAHSDSIRTLSSTISSRLATSKLSFATSSPSASQQSTAPHHLTQRFGQFLHGILAISTEAGDDEPVSSSLGRLRNEYETFLQKASRGAGADAKRRERFLANNYALVLTIIEEVEGRLAGEQRGHFEELRRGIGGGE